MHIHISCLNDYNWLSNFVAGPRSNSISHRGIVQEVPSGGFRRNGLKLMAAVVQLVFWCFKMLSYPALEPASLVRKWWWNKQNPLSIFEWNKEIIEVEFGRRARWEEGKHYNIIDAGSWAKPPLPMKLGKCLTNDYGQTNSAVDAI